MSSQHQIEIEESTGYWKSVSTTGTPITTPDVEQMIADGSSAPFYLNWRCSVTDHQGYMSGTIEILGPPIESVEAEVGTYYIKSDSAGEVLTVNEIISRLNNSLLKYSRSNFGSSIVMFFHIFTG